MKNLIAQAGAGIPLSPGGNGFKGIGTSPLGNVTDNGINTFATFMSTAIGLITLIGIIWFVFIFLTGAVGIIASGGDKGALESAKKKLSTGVVGLVILVSATFLIDFLGYLLGFGSANILNLTHLFSLITGGTGDPRVVGP